MDAPPAVIDFDRQARIADITDTPSPFNIFNVFAFIVIALAFFFLYKRYKDKHATEKAHMMRPSPIIQRPMAPIIEEVNDTSDHT